MGITYKSRSQIEKMRIAGGHVAEILLILRDAVRPGVTTAELNAIAERELARRKGISCFKNYVIHQGVPPFPAVICTSINDEVVHGIPGRRALKDGDIIALDFGAKFDDWVGDSGITVPVGTISPQARHLLAVTERARAVGIEQAAPGKRLQDIGAAIQRYVESEGCSVVRHYTGHGVGRQMHEEPLVPNYLDTTMPNPVLRSGMVIAIEPMVNAGRLDTRVLKDKWTVVTADHSLSAYFEHTVAVTDHGPEILTLPLG